MPLRSCNWTRVFANSKGYVLLSKVSDVVLVFGSHWIGTLPTYTPASTPPATPPEIMDTMGGVDLSWAPITEMLNCGLQNCHAGLAGLGMRF